MIKLNHKYYTTNDEDKETYIIFTQKDLKEEMLVNTDSRYYTSVSYKYDVRMREDDRFLITFCRLQSYDDQSDINFLKELNVILD